MDNYYQLNEPEKFVPSYIVKDCGAQYSFTFACSTFGESEGGGVSSMFLDERDLKLVSAAESGNVSLVKKLLDAGADPSASVLDGDCALIAAARAGSPTICTALLARGADVNRAGFKHQYPLHHAALSNHLAVVCLLLQNGASINVEDSFGRTPLHYAASDGSAQVVKELFDFQAKCTRDGEGNTPLHVAALAGKPQVVLLMMTRLDFRMRIDAANEDGKTSLHLSLENTDKDNRLNRYEVARILLNHGASRRLTDSEGKLPAITEELEIYFDSPAARQAAVQASKHKPKTATTPRRLIHLSSSNPQDSILSDRFSLPRGKSVIGPSSLAVDKVEQDLFGSDSETTRDDPTSTPKHRISRDPSSIKLKGIDFRGIKNSLSNTKFNFRAKADSRSDSDG